MYFPGKGMKIDHFMKFDSIIACSKGQLISEGNFGVFDSSKK